MKANLAVLLAASVLFGAVSSVEAAPVKLLCRGPVTIEFDTEKVTDPARISVELDQAAGWVSFNGWAVGTERIPTTSAGTAVIFTHTGAGPGAVSITQGRIELSTGRLYLDTTFSSSNGASERWTTNWGVQVTTLRMTGDVPCRTP